MRFRGERGILTPFASTSVMTALVRAEPGHDGFKWSSRYSGRISTFRNFTTPAPY
jgi:hypothetical protein